LIHHSLILKCGDMSGLTQIGVKCVTKYCEVMEWRLILSLA
jgi:hypothetical protein